MQFLIKQTDPAQLKTACLVVPVFHGRNQGSSFEQLDKTSNGKLAKMLGNGDLDTSENGSLQMLYNVDGITAERILLVSLANEKDLTAKSFATAMKNAAQSIDQTHAIECSILMPDFSDRQLAYDAVRLMVTTIEDALYVFSQCKSDVKKKSRPLGKMSLLPGGKREKAILDKAIEHGKAIASGQSLAKDLANLPGNICTPTYLAEQAKKLKQGVGKLRVSVLEEKQMAKLGMGALLSVSRGSRQPAKLIIMEYRGAPASNKPVVLVGKGLTFDAGGISIKPAANMDEMKYDMCGGASVLGTIKACTELNLPINVVGVVPSSENLPDGDANKPGDIVTSMAGLTIEVLNTDAEGRLILCDALTYSEKFNPDVVIDIATLTGACIVALGRHPSGLMSNNDKLADELTAAGNESGDRVWRLPIWDDYQPQLDSNFADMANIGGPAGGTITAACFLSRFTKKYKWAHLDIAGTAWNSGGKEKGATGRPVALLTHYLLKRARAV
jgi:leucyl aminopeptidase